MNKITSFFSRYGFHSLLLLVFFIYHNYVQYYGLVSSKVAIVGFGKLSLIFAFLFAIAFVLTKNLNKSFLLITTLGIITLFFGNFKDLIGETLHLKLLAKYTVLLPLFLVILISFIRIINRIKQFENPNLYLNLLIILFIAIDVLAFLFSPANSVLSRNMLVHSSLNVQKLRQPANKPDVYFLILDSYPGTGFLKSEMVYDNSGFDSSLKARGFFVASKSLSNYNRTAFSIASELNLGYLEKIRSHSDITAKDYNEARTTVAYSKVPEIFKQFGYSIYNLSGFDIKNNPSMVKETFLTLPEERVLFYNIITERIRKDLGWQLMKTKLLEGWVKKGNENVNQELFRTRKDYNRIMADSVQKIAVEPQTPKFIYLHLYLPHPPFYYDENGKANDSVYITKDESLENRELFLSYLKYTNKKITSIIDSILAGSKTKPVIILQSDHGFRDFKGWKSKPGLYFQNYSAFYFPDHDYSMLYDSISNVNTFRIVFNKQFRMNFPLLKDSTVALDY
jgi:hypothetical protein